MANLFKKLFSRSEPPTGMYSPLISDLHSHLIPGIDDGAQTPEESVELVRSLIQLGFTRAVTTPHVMSDGFPNTQAKILAGLQRLQQALEAAGIDFPVIAAAEYYVDEAFEEMVANEPLLTFGGAHKYVLFETSYVTRPLSLESVIFEMNTRGYTPVMAHPERYSFFWDGDAIEQIGKLRELGVKMQVNISSFAGVYNTRAAKVARELCKEGWIDFLGSDLHKERQVAYLHDAWKKSKEIKELVGQGTLLNSNL